MDEDVLAVPHLYEDHLANMVDEGDGYDYEFKLI